MRVILPDVLLLVVSIFCLVLCNKVNTKNIELKRLNFYGNNPPKTTTTTSTTFTDKMLFKNLTQMAINNSNDDESNQVNALSTSHSNRETAANIGTTSESLTYSTLTPPLHPSQKDMKKSSPFSRFLKVILPILREMTFMLLLFACATFWPSVLSIPYFVSFLSLIVFWLFSSSKWTKAETTKLKLAIKIGLIFYLALHILCIYVYQLKLFQYALPANEMLARLLGLMNAFYTSCDQPAHFYLNPSVKWQQCVYPFILFMLYWFTAVEFSYLQMHKSTTKSDDHTKIATQNKPSVIISQMQSNPKVSVVSEC